MSWNKEESLSGYAHSMEDSGEQRELENVANNVRPLQLYGEVTVTSINVKLFIYKIIEWIILYLQFAHILVPIIQTFTVCKHQHPRVTISTFIRNSELIVLYSLISMIMIDIHLVPNEKSEL